MPPSKLQVKVFADAAAPGPALDAFIPVFHDWIKHHRLPELLIDVANYAHVPRGPGVALIGHASDYFIDESEGRRGLLYSRKRDALPPAERLADAFKSALGACVLLEKDASLAGKLRFCTDEFLLRVNDRLAAPNTPAAFAALRPEIETFCARVFAGTSTEIAQVGEPRDLLSARIKAPGAPALATLLGRL